MPPLWGESVLGLTWLSFLDKLRELLPDIGIGFEIQQLIITVVFAGHFFNLYGIPTGWSRGICIWFVVSGGAIVSAFRITRRQPKLFSQNKCSDCSKGILLPLKYQCSHCRVKKDVSDCRK